MKNKYAIVTTLNDKYIFIFMFMIKSLVKNFNFINTDFIILNIGLSKENIEKIKELYSFIKIIEVNFSNYDLKINDKIIPLSSIAKMNNTRMMVNYYKLEIFNIKDYEKLFFIDSDCIILNDISEVFTKYNEKAIYAVKDSQKYSVGIMLLNRSLIDCKYWYKNLIHNIYKYGGDFGCSKNGESDQAVLNEMLSEQFGELDIIYNFRIPKVLIDNTNTIFDKTKIKIVHFAGSYKPWDEETGRWFVDEKKNSDKIWKELSEEFS